MPENRIIVVMTGLALVASSLVVVADELLRDPTRPYRTTVRQSVAAQQFTVNAIFSSAERRIAIVNGQRVGVGGQVNGATVIAIEKNELTLSMNDKRITARLAHGASSK